MYIPLKSCLLNLQYFLVCYNCLGGGKSIEEESTEERISVRQSPLSSFGELTPEKEETIGNIEKIPAVIKIIEEKAQLKQPIHTKPIGKKPVAKNESLSPILSPFSLVC